MKIFNSAARFSATSVFCLVIMCAAHGQTVTKVVDHGPDGEKLTFVVLGDGYAAGDQTKFAQDVNRLLVNGVFGHDFYKDNFPAFNMYRVDLVSHESGVSSPSDS